MAFKRMEGFAGSVPQGFIDRNVKVCPLCGTTNPHWSIDQKMQMKLEGNLYLFKCEQCNGILSSPVPKKKRNFDTKLRFFFFAQNRLNKGLSKKD